MHFTVITPTHQRRELLPEAVATVSAPLAFSFEHLIYDNGSHDGTAAYFWAFARPMSAPLPPPADAEVYNIPAAHRKMENLHIVFWLLKDLA